MRQGQGGLRHHGGYGYENAYALAELEQTPLKGLSVYRKQKQKLGYCTLI